MNLEDLWILRKLLRGILAEINTEEIHTRILKTVALHTVHVLNKYSYACFKKEYVFLQVFFGK